MRLSPYLHRELVFTDLEATDNLNCIEALVDAVLGARPDLDRAGVLGALLDREKQVATGLQSGVAVPHATVGGLSRTVLAVARLRREIDFGALDGRPVRFVFLMLSPSDDIASHIRLLARIARLCSSPAFLRAMGAARDAGDLFAVIAEEDGRHV